MKKALIGLLLLMGGNLKADPIAYQFDAQVSGPGVSGFDLTFGDRISGLFSYGTSSTSPLVEIVVGTQGYRATPAPFSFYMDNMYGYLSGAGNMVGVNASMGIVMIGSGPLILHDLTGCDFAIGGCNQYEGYDLPPPTPFPFLTHGAAMLLIRSDNIGFGVDPIDPGYAFSHYYLNADITSITQIPEPASVLLLGVTLLWVARLPQWKRESRTIFGL